MVSSTVVAQIGYEATRQTLRIVFHRGGVYEFYLVPRKIFDEFLAAESKGAFFDERLRHGPYPYEQVRPG